jgi:hypothetical protein
MQERIKKLLRRVIRWAFTDSKGKQWGIMPVRHVWADIEIDRSKAEEILILSAHTPAGRKVTVSTIRKAKVNREL